MNLNKEIKYNGYVNLLSVMLISIVGISITTTLLIVTSSLNNSYRAGRDSSKARYAAESCVEYALENLQSDNGYTSGEIVSLDNSECEVIEIIGTGNTNREVRIEGRSGDSVERYSIMIHHLAPSVEIIDWKRVSDFD